MKYNFQIISLASHLPWVPWETAVDIQLGHCTHWAVKKLSNSVHSIQNFWFIPQKPVYPPSPPHFSKWHCCSARCAGKTLDFSFFFFLLRVKARPTWLDLRITFQIRPLLTNSQVTISQLDYATSLLRSWFPHFPPTWSICHPAISHRKHTSDVIPLHKILWWVLITDRKMTIKFHLTESLLITLTSPLVTLH